MIQVNLWGFQWNSMDFKGFQGISRVQGVLRDFKGFQGISRDQGVLRDFKGFQGIAMDFSGFQ